MEFGAQTPFWVLAPPGATVVSLMRPRKARQALSSDLRDLPPGSDVVILDQSPASRWRVKRYAARAGVVLERGYVAVPSLNRPLVLVQDRPNPLAHFVNEVMAVPPKPRRTRLLVAALLRLTSGRHWLLGACAPARISVGRRT